MTITFRLFINLFVLHSLCNSKTETPKNTNWSSNKKNDTKQPTDKEPLGPTETYETDVLFENTVITFKNITYEKHLTFWSFGSYFNIYLKKQPLFHPDMTVIHTSGGSWPIDVDIPKFYTGFNNDTSLSIVHGRFYDNNFKCMLNWNNATIEIDCPHAKTDDKYVLSCKISSFKFDAKKTFSDNIMEIKNSNKKFVKKSSENRKYRKYRRQVLNKRRSCSVHLVADHLYFKYVGSLSVGSTVEAMSSSVAVADAIFRGTDFDGDGYGDNIGFVIKNITIFKNPFGDNYLFNVPHISVMRYLELFSKLDFTGYCLGVAFTYRDFKKGVVGLAWVASSHQYEASGGICENNPEGGQNVNTLLITQLNDNHFYPGRKAALALTHEFGHSFGANHDQKSDKNCVPNNEYGNFIMYEYVISGDKPNNRLFSPCSIASINPVIRFKGTCLHIDKGPVCGNSIREDGEECDCGTLGTCRYVDPCCTPSDIPNGTGIPCTLIEGKLCSPKHSPCCGLDCLPIGHGGVQICRPKTDCTKVSYCDGVNSSCPKPVSLPDGTECNGGRQRCESGICLKSICEYLKLENCLCSSKALYCHVCCKMPNSSKDTCAPVSTFACAPNDTANLRIQKGQPCNAYTGFCDDNHECVTGSLNNVLDLLNEFLSSTFQHDIQNWLNHYWIYVLVACMCCVGAVVLFVVTQNRHRDDHVEALRLGRLTNALHDALLERNKYWTKMETFQKKIDSKIKQVMYGTDIDAAEAVGRLSILFPTASIPLLLEIARCSASEEAAVRILLIKGLSMRAFHVLADGDPQHCLLQIERGKTL